MCETDAFEKSLSLAEQYRKILIQAPDGLKNQALEIAEKLGEKAVVSLDHCYGACDLRDDEAQKVGCEALLHLGHKKFYKKLKAKVPVIYYIPKKKANTDFVEKDAKKIKENKLALGASLQFMHLLEPVKKLLSAKNKKITVIGQVLGCWIKEAQADAYLIITNGSFYVADKKTYVIDTEKEQIVDMEPHQKKMEKIRFGKIMKFKNCKKIGILVSTKPGQKNLQAEPEKIKKALEKDKKQAFILAMDEITPEKLEGLNIEGFINTACPRITDNTFKKPVINVRDFETSLKI